MATDLNLQVAGIKDDYKYGFHDSDDHYAFKSGKGLTREIVCQISEMKNEPRGCASSGSRRSRSSGQKPTPTWGGDLSRAELRRHPLLHEGGRPPGQDLGRRPGRDQEHLRQAGHPRGRAQVPGRRRRPVRVGGRLSQPPRGPAEEGRHLRRHRHGAARVSRPGQAVLRHDHPDPGQQVRRPQLGGLERRIVRLHPGRRQGRHPAPGLLPDQRREHGPVRADADHRRGGGPGPLRRGLHGADVLDREPALGGGRDHRQEGRRGAATRRSRTGPTTSTTS